VQVKISGFAEDKVSEEIEWVEAPYDVPFKNLKNNVGEVLKRFDQQLFTLHDANHCRHVERMVKAILVKAMERTNMELSPLERFLLFSAVWVHDVGMDDKIAEEYFKTMMGEALLDRKREEHHYISAWYLLKYYEEIFSKPTKILDKLHYDLERYVRSIAVIIRYHRKIESLDTCPKTDYIKGEIIRLRLLSAILRLADTLHIDSTRVDPNLYAMVQIAAFDRAARLHWLKSFFVSNVHINPETQTISVTLDLPDHNLFAGYVGKSKSPTMGDIWKLPKKIDEQIKNLEYIINSDIKEDLVAVNKIFTDYKIPTYVRVKIQRRVVPGFSIDAYNEFVSLLSELDMLFSPYTSKVIKRALECLRSFQKHDFKNRIENFQSQLRQMLVYFDQILAKRPCHLGLRKIRDLVELVQRDLNRCLPSHPNPGELIGSFQAKLGQIANLIENSMDSAKEKIAGKCKEVIGEEAESIFLFGYSSTVLKLLGKMAVKEPHARNRLKIFVLECSGKRKFTHSNLLEYNDGLRYAIDISKLGYKKVFIIPDTAFPSLLNMGATATDISQVVREIEPPDPGRSVVLFGTNGIDENGDCGHTSGHLMVCIIAGYFKVPVKVVTHSFKIGTIPWNLQARREGDWLTTQPNLVEDMRDSGVQLFNPREDKIPFNLVSEIYTESIDIRGSKSEKKNQLAELLKFSRESFEKLKYCLQQCQ